MVSFLPACGPTFQARQRLSWCRPGTRLRSKRCSDGRAGGARAFRTPPCRRLSACSAIVAAQRTSKMPLAGRLSRAAVGIVRREGFRHPFIQETTCTSPPRLRAYALECASIREILQRLEQERSESAPLPVCLLKKITF